MQSGGMPPARLAGLLSLLTLGAGIFGEFFALDTMIVSGDPAATAARILDGEALFRLGFVANLVDYVCYVGVSVILYALLKPVQASMALFALVASVIATAIVVTNTLFLFAPLLILKSGAADAEALAAISLRLRGIGTNAGMVFFGLHLLFAGLLIAKATFLPRVLGGLSALGGLCFIINSITGFLAPSIASQLLPFILAPGILAQAALAVWLLLMGVNAEKWRAQASAT